MQERDARAEQGARHRTISMWWARSYVVGFVASPPMGVYWILEHTLYAREYSLNPVVVMAIALILYIALYVYRNYVNVSKQQDVATSKKNDDHTKLNITEDYSNMSITEGDKIFLEKERKHITVGELRQRMVH